MNTTTLKAGTAIQETQRKKERNRSRIKQNLKGYAFIAPSYILLLIFTIFPMLFSLVLAFTEWDLLSGFKGIKFVGLDNFLKMPKDIWFTSSMFNNIYFTIVFVPLTILLALIFSLILNDYVYGKNIFRLFFFMPYISNIAAVSILWSILYSPYGPIAGMLRAIGVEAPNFLADTHWAMPAIIAMSVWMSFGYCTMIYIAGMQGIPNELYEAAAIDGVNWWQKLTKITVPMLSPTTFFILITQIIGSFKAFGQIQIMTHGGPVRSTSVLVYYIYEAAFHNYKFGYASAMALILFLIILAITLIQWQGQKKWVNY